MGLKSSGKARKKTTRARASAVALVRELFLQAYAETGSISASIQKAGVSSMTRHYEWLKNVPGYREKFEEAHEKSVAVLEMEARRRAHEGWEEPVFYKGVQVGRVRKFSDNLLMFLLRAANPAKYRENQKVEVTGADGEPIRVEVTAAIGKVYGQAVPAPTIEVEEIEPKENHDGI